MKKTKLTILTTLILGSNLLYAENAGPYVGVGYTKTNVDFTLSTDIINNNLFDESTDTLLLLAGFNINEYIGIEGRYYWNITSMAVDYYASGIPIIEDYKAESFAIYAKPQYSFDIVSLYALIGVTMNNYTALLQSSDDMLFSWGLGAKVNMTQNLSAFVDYTDLGETDKMITTGLSSWNIGICFNF